MSDIAAFLPDDSALEAPAALLPYQQAWVADPCELKVAEKSRRVGLTWAEAADDVLIAASNKMAGGQNVFYTSYNKDMTIEFIQACAMWARVFNKTASAISEGIWDDGDEIKDPEKRYIKTYVIEFPNSGFRIEALTSRPSNLRGRQGVLVIDEGAFCEDLELLLTAALAFLIWGGKVRVISSHNGDDNPFNGLVNDIRAGKQAGTVHRITFDEAVAQGLYYRVCLRKQIPWVQEEQDEWVKKVRSFYKGRDGEELDVIPARGNGTWLTHQLLMSRSEKGIPVVRFKAPPMFEIWTEDARYKEIQDLLDDKVKPLLDALPPNINTFHGKDFARRSDLSVDWFLGQRQNMDCFTLFVLELANIPYKQQEQVVFFCLDRLPNLRGSKFDAGGNGGYLAEQAVYRYGAIVEAVQFSEAWYRENTPAFKADLEDGTLSGIPADKDIIDDHRAFKMVKGVARIPDKRTVGEDGNSRHGDSAIAHLLAHAASRQPVVPAEWTSAGRADASDKRRFRDDDTDNEPGQAGCY
jgi:phage FluMu gp28-like protein